MSIYFFNSEFKMSMTGLTLPVRATIIQDASRLILLSPIDFTEDQLSQIKQIGMVTDIVAPTLIHHLFVLKAKAQFPASKLWGVPGFQNKRADIPWDGWILDQKFSNLRMLMLEGAPDLNEVVFLHEPTKTLVVSDLVFNLQNPKGVTAPLLLRLLGTYKKLNVSQLILNRFIKDRGAFKKSLEQMMAWDFERVVMSHGEIVQNGGKAHLRVVFQKHGLL